VGECWWLTPVILAAQESEIRRIEVQSQPEQIVHKILSGANPPLVERLKVEALSSNLRTAHTHKKRRKLQHAYT
jgi:hypothetical protein